ncbi:hypothetical protein DW682_07015 [Collinsella intestinalis]|uniref:non-specific serine/threonine protein kinase n=2 Tax=Collinsella intestinalis TaxID=147207 RepID=A0A414NED1_9ACTN|nr:hypothetical protein DW682_07015 [Collinsella intestinalis]
MMQAMKNSDDISAADASSSGDETFHHELEAYLTQSAEATTWHVERVIKQSEFETTELVRGRPREGVAGRYVRKVIDAASGAGAAYEELWRAQERGESLACVPRLVECARSGNTLTVVMEHVDGCTVDALQRAIGAGERLAMLVLPPLSRAVTELHTALPRPLIHRDLKPSNVIMRDGKAVVIDFGSARMWHPDASSDTTHFLTRCYAPPEQFGFGQTDERTDVYALGKILYFCLTGEQPPNTCGAAECREKGMGETWAQLVGTACAFDPADRYASVADFGAAVSIAAESRPCASTCATGRRIPVRSMSFRLPALRNWNPLSLIPSWAGRVWNSAILVMLAMMLWMSVETIFNPMPKDAGRSMEYLFAQNILCVDPLLIIGAYLLMDRRRLRARYPKLARWGILRETVYGVITMVVVLFGSALFAVMMGWA